MVTTRFYLDCRAVKGNAPAPLKLSITKQGVASYIPMNVSLFPNQWDKRTCLVTNHPQKRQLNAFLAQRKVEIDNIIFSMISNGEFTGMRSVDIKNKVVSLLNPIVEIDKSTLFAFRFNAFSETKNPRTRKIYQGTFRHLQKFAHKALDSLTFEDITKDWLIKFDAYLVDMGLAQNSRFIHFRNIRSVFNDAIDNDITTAYPFRKFKFRPAPTRKRSFSVEVLRKVMLSEVPENLRLYQDIFNLTFLLIGINIVDLCSLSEIVDGRVSYIRAKTGKQYSIKVEPEALAIIERNRGINQLLFVLDHYKTYRTFYTRLCGGLSALQEYLNTIDDGMPISELTTYWARHSWATIASSIDVPKDTIAAGLGHDMGNSTTAIYIDFDRHKVDEANRRVIDWVLYQKK